MEFIEQGWQCPVCKAVMSPKERMCVNCRGSRVVCHSAILTINDDQIVKSPSADKPHDFHSTISSNMQAHFDALDEEFAKFYQNKEGL